MRNLLTAMLTAGALLGAAGSASAANPATTSFTVTATVLKNCSVGATNLGFGNYTPGNGALTATSTITVSCTKGTTYTVALNGGSSGGTVAQRQMLQTAGTSTLQYNLCTNVTTAAGLCQANQAWGDGTNGTVMQNGTGAGMGGGNATAFSVNGGLPDNANNQTAAVVGISTLYSDLVTVSVAY